MSDSSTVRLSSLDAARGMAMLLVCLAHYLDVYLYSARVVPLEVWVIDLAILVCRSAAPTFVLVSGVLLGYQLVTRGGRFNVFRTHLLDRALFLALIGHVVM